MSVSNRVMAKLPSPMCQHCVHHRLIWHHKAMMIVPLVIRQLPPLRSFAVPCFLFCSHLGLVFALPSLIPNPMLPLLHSGSACFFIIPFGKKLVDHISFTHKKQETGGEKRESRREGNRKGRREGKRKEGRRGERRKRGEGKGRKGKRNL